MVEQQTLSVVSSSPSGGTKPRWGRDRARALLLLLFRFRTKVRMADALELGSRAQKAVGFGPPFAPHPPRGTGKLKIELKKSDR